MTEGVPIPHPFERERAARDRIALRGHVVEAEIGAFAAERGRTQRLRFDIVAEVEPPDAPPGDDVDRILSYDCLAEAVAAELAGERADLLETLAERVAAHVLAEPMAARVFVRVEKLDRGPGALGVEILREAGEAAAAGAIPGPRPALVHLDRDAAADPRPLLDALAPRGPLVLCVGPPEPPAPRAATPEAQRRIDLLALDQAAWVLASRDPRLAVAGSRTEIEWALRRGHPVVWAPSRIAPSASGALDPAGAVALTAWLGDLLDATRLVIAGDGPSPPTDRPVERIPAGGRIAPASAKP